jgi:hypothetical protein
MHKTIANVKQAKQWNQTNGLEQRWRRMWIMKRWMKNRKWTKEKNKKKKKGVFRCNWNSRNRVRIKMRLWQRLCYSADRQIASSLAYCHLELRPQWASHWEQVPCCLSSQLINSLGFLPLAFSLHSIVHHAQCTLCNVYIRQPSSLFKLLIALCFVIVPPSLRFFS